MYAKVFTQIFDSSIADNWKHRHVFEDLLKLCDRDGVLDMTPEAIAARTRLPLDMVNEAIEALSSPDPRSRTRDYEGRRLIPLDSLDSLESKRGWGWLIVNYAKYREMKTQFDKGAYMAEYMQKYRAKSKNVRPKSNRVLQKSNTLDSSVSVVCSVQSSVKGSAEGEPKQQDLIKTDRKKFVKPTIEEMKLHAAKIGLPESEVVRCWNYYESKGWLVGRSPMRSWPAAMVTWRSNWQERGSTWIPSQSSEPAHPNGANIVIMGKELDRVIEKMKTIRNTYGDHQTWREQDRIEFDKLKSRRDELRKVLGVVS